MKKLPFLLVTALLLPLFVSADTVLTDTLINNDEVWNLEGSPYIISGSVIVDEASLTIEPGVVVKFEDDAELAVSGGQIVAQGTPEEPIIFTALNNSFQGVIIFDSPLSSFHHVAISYADDGVVLFNASAEFDNTHIHDSDGGVLAFTQSSVSIADSQFSNIGIDNSALMLFDSNAYVEKSIFDGGLRSGIESYNSDIHVTRSTFSNHAQSGVEIYGVLDNHSFVNNSFYDNLAYGLESYSEASVDARESWWGDLSGPYEPVLNPDGLGDEIYGDVLFVPFLTQPLTLEQTVNPVIIVPGIMGSAYKNGQLVIDPILHTYDDLIATLVGNGYEEGVDLFTFPYEWRDSNALTANLLDDKISEIKEICDCGKVDIVAHSMGGLVARAYVQSGEYDGDVDQLVFLGVPHKGAPKDYLIWEAGKFPVTSVDTFIESLFIVEARKNGYSTVFDYIRQRPVLSVQELLPIFDYIEENDSGVLRQYPDSYPRNFFLETLDTNISNLINSGVEVTNIVGDSGENKTIERIRVVQTDHAIFWEHGEPEGFGVIIGDSGLERGVGDNTVTLDSATLSIGGNEDISASHNRIPTLSANKVVKILKGVDSVTNIDNGIDLDLKVLLLQLLSPIDLVVTAPDGKKIGKNFDTGEEYGEIPLAFYSGHETDEEYITILNPLEGEYKVELVGTDSGGEYQVVTSYISDATSTTEILQGVTEPDQVTNLQVSLNENTISQNKVVTAEVLLNDINKSYELGWITDSKLRDKLVKKAEAIVRLEDKIEEVAGSDKKNKERRLTRLEAMVDKKACRALLVELRGYKRDKINEEAYNIIKYDLEWLLNN